MYKTKPTTCTTKHLIHSINEFSSLSPILIKLVFTRMTTIHIKFIIWSGNVRNYTAMQIITMPVNKLLSIIDSSNSDLINVLCNAIKSLVTLYFHHCTLTKLIKNLIGSIKDYCIKAWNLRVHFIKLGIRNMVPHSFKTFAHNQSILMISGAICLLLTILSFMKQCYKSA